MSERYFAEPGNGYLAPDVGLNNHDLGLAATRVSSASFAIVHDYLNQRGGAERVVLELSDMWPDAPIYTSLYRAQSTFPEFARREVRTTALDRVRVDRGFRGLFLFYPAAFRMLGEIDADVVLSSSSGWAHMARVKPGALHVVYCHTPARWLYRDEHLGSAYSARRMLARPALGTYRRLDRKAAARAHLYIANSANVQRRIRGAYGIDAALVPPPVDVDRFRPSARGERLLTISRLLPYKHVELVVRAATSRGFGLDVVGEGPLMPALREMAGPTVTFHGGLDDEALIELIQACGAVCVAAEEDFGMVAVEAQAAGKPVIAYGRGGSLETVEDGVTGIFFYSLTEAALIGAITACDRLDTPPETIARHVARFSRQFFRERLARVIEAALAQRVDRDEDVATEARPPRGEGSRRDGSATQFRAGASRLKRSLRYSGPRERVGALGTAARNPGRDGDTDQMRPGTRI